MRNDQRCRAPVDAAVLDGEAVAGDGHEGIQSVVQGANYCRPPDGRGALRRSGRDVMREPWRDRRKRLEFTCTHPRTRARVEITRAVRVPRGDNLELLVGAPARCCAGAS